MLIYVLLIFKQKSEEKAYITYKKYFIHIWGAILAYKLWNEWYLHYENLDLSLLLFGVTDGR